ncbi:hypothetical protein OG422_24850 [Streptomyces sp. NBC_01525]|uniref:Uncharacterized protein n=1 Tax=Streptomyces benahoarensis TaxID=2595054 RepID=A0A553YAZ8_9ACTN|nr:hypothetical protein [Streptomyces benahoarensis]TSB16405.1 hypothetical protein FNJ62_28305 [Streptomyces benahoarensis]TSB26369.1 hypothetical protein FNZ23_26805 [Streptomyces benahoarensis]
MNAARDAAAARVVVLGADRRLRAARADRLAAHYRVPRRAAADILAAPCPPPAGYVVDAAPRLLARFAGAGGPPPALAFADLMVHLRTVVGGVGDAYRAIRYYEARGVLVGFRPDVPDEELYVVIEAALRERRGGPPGARP